ncbi:hypothetical protein [Clostridium sp. DJ247]|uniref:hypothetical protein n=1 Tax=Clostridium sp. DJ247 TaxID=2726188 RepID=UPI0016242F39|nr:hypothetical protein [Clostridium sp. DJ247]MBC2581775.1 hypothetical protein [Clostridium sp. DJ247]
MDNIKFLGYFADGTFKKACKQRENPTSLDTFYNAVNQATASGCCSCCKQEVIVYAVQPVELPIKPAVLSLCVECLSSLPIALEVINLSSHGAPPLLVQVQKEV